ncbi:uncharacterized protein JCM15063_002251 [Sporobolomyces koalae]|uniref:uncharacterized protein n=1 Tax=Sporobolomyces koalae TaxID=500713 RepID=UPI0031821F5B
MRTFSFQPPFTSSFSHSIGMASSPVTAEMDVVPPSTSNSTKTKRRSSTLVSGLKGFLRRRHCDRSDISAGDYEHEMPAPLPIDACDTIKRNRRQTYVMHFAATERPKPLPVLTLSAHHLVVLENDRRDLAARATHDYSYLTPIPEYASIDRDSDPYTSSSSIASSSSSSFIASSSSSSSSSTLDSIAISEQVLDSPQSHWSDDSSDEIDYTTPLCQCNDLTFTNSTSSSRLCSECVAAQDVPEDAGCIDSDVESLLDSYLEDDSADEYKRERWSRTNSAFSSTSSRSSVQYDPLFSPRTSSTTFVSVPPRLHKSRPNTPVDLRDFDMIITSSPPSPTGKRFRRSTLEAPDSLLLSSVQSRPRRSSTQTV